MAAPAEVAGESEQDTYAFARAYLGLGFSLVPLAPHAKEPHHFLLPRTTAGKPVWGAFIRKAPDLLDVMDWCRKSPDMGIGIVCGAVSGNLAVIDIDDVAYSRWVEANLPSTPFATTWVVRTGSGKLHVYVRAPKFDTHLLRAADGRKLADVRGEGQYVAAPPSLHPETGGEYYTLYGSPLSIVSIADMEQLLESLRRQYAGGAARRIDYGGRLEPSAGSLALGDSGSEVSLSEEELVSRLRKAGTKMAIRRSILHGPSFGDWPGAEGDRSRIDYGIARALYAAGLTLDETAFVFRHWPCSGAYADEDRNGSRGEEYLKRTLDKAWEDASRQSETAARGAGDNFETLSVVRINYPGAPIYEVRVRYTGVEEVHTPEGVILLKHADMASERAIKAAAMRDLGWYPQFADDHRGNKASKLGDIWALAAVWEEVPEEASERGHLKQQVITAITERMWRKQAPEDAGDVGWGWWDDDSRTAYVHGGTLIAHLGRFLRPAPRPEEVWDVLSRLGATETNQQIGTARLSLWAVPSEALS